MPLHALAAARAASVARARARPTAVWLGGVVLVSAAVRFALAASVPVPAIFPDETIYAELARGISSSGEFTVRDSSFSAWTFGPLYALLISPAYLIGSLPDAYLAVKAINSVVMSLAAIPAYFIARRVVDERLARLAAVFAVLLPAMAYSSRVMTESAFYPAFLVVILAIIRALEEPTARRQLIALGTIALACGVRPQALVLLPVLLTAICVQAAYEQRTGGALSIRAFGRHLSTYRMIGGVLIALAALMALMSAATNRGPVASVWDRSTYIAERVDPLGVPKWIVYHVAELEVAVGVIPFIAALLFIPSALDRARTGRGAQAFAVVMTATTVWMILLAGTFASQADVVRIQERYVFYVEPLLLIAFLAWIHAGHPRQPRGSLIVAAAALLPLLLPYGSLLNYHAFASTPGLVPWLLGRQLAGALATTAIVGALAVGCAVAVIISSRVRLSLTAPVAVYLVVSSLLATAGFQAVSARSQAVGLGTGEMNWIDRAVGGRGRVLVLWSAAGTSWMRDRRVWESEFFNRQVGSIYYLRRPLAYDLPQARAHLRRSTVVAPDGRAIHADYVLSDGPVVAGEEVAARPSAGLTLYRVDGPIRLLGAPGNRPIASGSAS